MRYLLIFILVFLNYNFSFGQKDKEVEIFKKKSGDYPQFIYDKIEYDSIIFWNKQMTIEALNGYWSAKAKVSFYVDSVGNLGNLSVTDFEMQRISNYIVRVNNEDPKRISDDLKNEALRLIALTSGLWKPANEFGKIVKKRMFAYIYFNAETERKVASDNSEKPQETINTKVIMTSHLVKPNEGYKQAQLFSVAERKSSTSKQELANVYYKQAVRFNENKIANTPNDVNAYYDMGVCYVKLSDYNHACKCWKQCVNMGDAEAQNLINKYCK